MHVCLFIYLEHLLKVVLSGVQAIGHVISSRPGSLGQRTKCY